MAKMHSASRMQPVFVMEFGVVQCHHWVSGALLDEGQRAMGNRQAGP
jgi:hypothetical protein